MAFIRSHDGGEGTIGEDYIVFDPVDEILAASDSEYRRRSLLPFTSDGGDRLYVFKVQGTGCPVLMLSMTSTSAGDVRRGGDGFRDFIERLSRGEVSWIKGEQRLFDPMLLTGDCVGCHGRHLLPFRRSRGHGIMDRSGIGRVLVRRRTAGQALPC